MATRSSIKNKNKAKLGTVASLAAGGFALSVDAGANDSLGSSNALLESAFRLLEEGQNLFLSADDNQAPQNNRFKLEVNPTGVASDSVDQMSQLTATNAPVSDVVMAQAQNTDIVLAQANTTATTAASETAVGGVTSSGAGGAAGATAAGTGSAAIVGGAPLAGLVGAGFAATTVVAVAADNNSGGSDLNDDQDDTAANGSAKLFGFSGGSDGGNESSGQSVNADVIGGSSFIDDSTNSFFS